MDIVRELETYASAKVLESTVRFFRMGEGEYGEHDKFIGVTVPNLRKVGRKYQKGVTLGDIDVLLHSKYNEYRYLGLIMLVELYKKSGDVKYVRYYMKNLKYVNNWNLVDVSSAGLLGAYIYENDLDDDILKKLATGNVWKRRIAIIATMYFIKRDYYDDTFNLAVLLLGDKHDLIHKAVGWMLREVGKKNKKLLIKFLTKYYNKMARTTFQYATKHLSPKEKATIKGQ